MKILHVMPSFGLGGMEKVICSIINYTFNEYKYGILSLDGNNSAFKWIKSNNVEKINFSKSTKLARYLIDLYQEIRKFSPDLLMTYNWGATDAIWIGKLAGIKSIIHHEHGFSIEEAQMTIWKRDICRFVIYRVASSLITVSSRLKRSIQTRYCLNEKHIQLIPNGIDPNYYSPDCTARRMIRHELNLDEEDFVIVFSGRLDPVKNFELLLEVLQYCRNIDKKVKLLVIGDGPERQKIEQISMQKNISSGLVMVGQKFEVLPYLRAGDVFLLTSVTEQMPLTILEAMSVGLPVIASDVGEIRHIVDDGKNGFVRDIRHGCEGFASALLRLKDSADLQAMSCAARSKIVRGFQETTMVHAYQTLIENLAGQYRH